MAKVDFSIRDVYQLVDARTAEIMNKFDALEVRVGVLETWKANFMGKMSIVIAVIVFGLTFLTDWIRKQLKMV